LCSRCCHFAADAPPFAGPYRVLNIAVALQEEFDLTPAGIMERLDLKRPIYYPTAAYGHFGRDDLDLPWEETR
jgi:S-adenosylmethionine synthetase